MLDNFTRSLLNGDKKIFEALGLEKVPTMIDAQGADTGGINSLPHGKSIWRQGNDTTPGTLIFDPVVRAPGQPWDNSYNYNTITRNPQPVSILCWELDFVLAASDLKGNAREFEAELCEVGWTYNMALQYKWSNVDGPPAWRMFDQTAVKNKWVPIPGIPAPNPVAGKFISVQAYFVIDRAAGVTWHDSVVIDGVYYPINVPHKKMFKWPSKPTYLHNAVQIDPLNDGQVCTVQIRNWNVRGL
jgi:hypothetical protein